MKTLSKALLIVLICATTAAWLKILFPFLSIGYSIVGPAQSLRNNAGIIVAMPLYELFYLGWVYLLTVSGYALVSHFYFNDRPDQRTAIGLGLGWGVGAYGFYKLYHYVTAAASYSRHSVVTGIAGSKPWYTWVELPQDAVLLIIYGLVGLIGGWLYYRWLVASALKPAL